MSTGSPAGEQLRRSRMTREREHTCVEVGMGVAVGGGTM